MVGSGRPALESLEDIVSPSDFELLPTDHLDLIAHLVRESLNRVVDKRKDVAARLRSSFELAVIVGPGLVVVVAQKVGRGRWHSRFDQDLELHQARRTAISIAEWVNPSQVKMSENGLEDAHHYWANLLPNFEGGAVEPRAQALEQVLAIFGRRASVGPDSD